MNNNKALYDVRKIRDFRDLISQSVELFGNEPAFKIKNSQGEYYDVTFKEFQADIQALGTALYDMGMSGQKIAVMGKNSYEWCTSYLAVTSGLGVIVPIDKELMFEDINNILSVSDTQMIFVDKNAFEKLFENREKLNPNLKLVCFENEEDKDGVLSYDKLINYGRYLLKEGATEYINAPVDPDALSVLIFTSGTMGMSKGVMLSQTNICFVAMSNSSVAKIGPGDRLLSVLPLHHTYECTLGFLMVLYNGCCISFCEGLLKLMKNMQEIEPTVFVSVPLMIEKIHARIMRAVSEKRGGKLVFSLGKVLSTASSAIGVNINDKIFKEIQKNFGGKLRLAIVGAAPVRPDVIADFKMFGIPIYVGYGLTECAPLVACNHDALFDPDTVGKPIPGIDIKVQNPDFNGIGEILVKGPNVMLGYYKDEQATSEVLDDDGWLHTGDLGSQDEEGILRIMGRIKNVIVTKNGKNIYPEEVEFYLNSNPLISEVMVVGNEDESETVVEAKIFPDINAIAEKLKIKEATMEDISKVLDDVIKEVNKKLPSYKNIKKIHIRDTEFIKTTTSKIKRYANIEDNFKSINENELAIN